MMNPVIKIEGYQPPVIASDNTDDTGVHYMRVVLRDDEIDRIAQAVVRLLEQRQHIPVSEK